MNGFSSLIVTLEDFALWALIVVTAFGVAEVRHYRDFHRARQKRERLENEAGVSQ